MTRRDDINKRRAQLAATLIEYRAFAREHPDDELTPTLLDVSADVRHRLRARREVMRAIGWTGEKVAA